LIIAPIALAPAETRAGLFKPENLIAAAAPIMFGLALAALAIHLRWRGAHIPPGDLLIGLERMWKRLWPILIKQLAGTFSPFQRRVRTRITTRTARWVRILGQFKRDLKR
jgi:hypothetical protein